MEKWRKDDIKSLSEIIDWKDFSENEEDFGKICLQFLEDANWDRAILKERLAAYDCKNEHIDKILSYAIEYRKDEDVRKRIYKSTKYLINNKVTQSKTNALLMNLLKCQNTEEGLELLRKYGKFEGNITESRCMDFASDFFVPSILLEEDASKELDKDTTLKVGDTSLLYELWYDVYPVIKKKIERLNNGETLVEDNRFSNISLEQARLIMKDFLTSNMTREEYSKSRNIDYSLFYKISSLLEESKSDKTLYNSYLETLQKELSYKAYEIIENIKILPTYLQHGIEVDGAVKKFDLLDYHTMFKGLPFQKLIRIIDQKGLLSKKDSLIVKKFFTENQFKKGYNNSDIEIIYRDSHLIPTEWDKDGFPLSTSQRELTFEEKKSAFEYLNSILAPITAKTYSLAIRRLFIEPAKRVSFANNGVSLKKSL